MLTEFLTTLSTPDKPGGRIGWFRYVCAGLGGFAVAYSAMAMLVCLIPGDRTHVLFIPFLFTPFAWACTGLWISLSSTHLKALVRSCVPTLLFSLAVAWLV
nr:hypothetical protein [uncultured Desulfobacter sp.]